ncbi:MAG: PP2C family serine/threonine-protein phosphatase [bacterium]
MIFWKSFGASVIGPGHIADKMPNQDSWAFFHRLWGDGIVVSDGLGSKPLSDLGSRAACLAVLYAAQRFSQNLDPDHTVLADLIKRKWMSFLEPLDPNDCAATCLFALRTNKGNIIVGVLGDGLAAIIKADGTVVLLTDDKSEGFSNITIPLSKNVTVKDWQWLTLPENDCLSIVLCTDGVADDLHNPNDFVKEFYDSYRKLSSTSASRRIRQMLENWPTPKHSDDKTIACLFWEEMTDE